MCNHVSRNRFKSFSNNHFEEPTVNLTPLIDVVFVILIMFIVIAPLLELDRVELAMAPSNPLDTTVSAAQEPSPIAVHVHPDNTIWLNQRQVALDDLAEELRQAKDQHPGVNPQIFHDRRAHFGTYQSVKNAAEEAGFHQMEIILKPA